MSGNQCIVVTPDRDVQEAVLEIGGTDTEIKRMVDGRLPGRVREKDTYLPRHSEKGIFGHDEMRKLVAIGEKRGQAFDRRRVTGRVGPDGRIHATPVGKAAPPKPEREVAVSDGEAEMVSIVVHSTQEEKIGTTVIPPAGAYSTVVGGRRYHLFTESGVELVCKSVHHDEVDHVREKLVGEKPAVGPDPDEKDVRVLSVLFDTAEERWRTVHEAVPDFEEIDYDDFPLQGPRTIAHDTRQLRRLGFDFVQHHESWVKKSGVRVSDRSVHEHSAICRCLNYMMCYDQLNLCALASAEALNRRRTLIEHAHQGRPDAPSYEGAEDFLGVRESADGAIIDPALASHAAKKQASRAEILKQTRLAAEEKRLSKKGQGKGDKEAGGGSAPSKP